MSFLLGFLLAAVPLSVFRLEIFDLPTNLFELLTVLVALAVLAAFSRRKDGLNSLLKPIEKIRKLGLFWPIWLIVLGLIIGFFVSLEKTKALGVIRGWFVLPGVLGFLVLLFETKGERRRLILGLVFGGFCLAILGLIQSFIGSVLPYQQAEFDLFRPYLEAGRVFASFESPNFLAMYLSPLVFLSLAELHLKSWQRYRWSNLFVLGFLALAIIVLLMADSRGAYLGSALALGFSLLIRLGLGASLNQAAFARSLMVLVVLLVALWFGFQALRPKPNDLSRIGQSSNIRVLIWRESIAMIKARPVLGIGLSNFQPTFASRTAGTPNYDEYIIPVAKRPHNLYLAFWLELSLFGLVGFLWLVYKLFLPAVRATLAGQSIGNLAPLSALVVILGHGLVDTPFFKSELAFLSLAILGLAISGSDDRKDAFLK